MPHHYATASQVFSKPLAHPPRVSPSFNFGNDMRLRAKIASAKLAKIHSGLSQCEPVIWCRLQIELLNVLAVILPKADWANQEATALWQCHIITARARVLRAGVVRRVPFMFHGEILSSDACADFHSCVFTTIPLVTELRCHTAKPCRAPFHFFEASANLGLNQRNEFLLLLGISECRTGNNDPRRRVGPKYQYKTL